MNSYNVSGTGCVCSFVGLRLRSLQEAQGYAVWMLRAHENWGWWVLCDYDCFLRGQQRANDDGCCSFGMLMMMTVRWRRRTTPGRVRIGTVAIVGFKAARTLQTHQIPVHLNTLINCTAPENKKKIGRENKMVTQWSRFFCSFLQFSSTISLSSYWYVFLSSQRTVNLFSVKKFAHLVSFSPSFYTRAFPPSLSISFRGLDCFPNCPSCCLITQKI